ncbi:hypothetical protein EIP86_004862 [Pleurotus ostreatoroseus]|nr:hypothetical protein EIP86_004862 [Pleurotus ostreatoroseus]
MHPPADRREFGVQVTQPLASPLVTPSLEKSFACVRASHIHQPGSREKPRRLVSRLPTIPTSTSSPAPGPESPTPVATREPETQTLSLGSAISTSSQRRRSTAPEPWAQGIRTARPSPTRHRLPAVLRSSLGDRLARASQDQDVRRDRASYSGGGAGMHRARIVHAQRPPSGCVALWCTSGTSPADTPVVSGAPTPHTFKGLDIYAEA